MNIFRFFIPLVLVFSSCAEDKPTAQSVNSPGSETTIPPPDSIVPPVAVAPDTIKVCFLYDKADEHHSIEINSVHDSAWGNLRWHIEGKDGVSGEFSGKFHGDTLWIIHQQIMEGHLIPREVAFLLKGEKLYEAQGTQEENEKGLYYYKHKKMLEYTDTKPMVKGPCM